MSKFIKKISFLFVIIISVYIALGNLADGFTDPFYLRLTTKKQNSLILGSSRAAQGVLPQILEEGISKNTYEGNIFNYSFTVNHSPFGKVYYKAIKEKLESNTKNGLFIIEVNPWTLSKSISIAHYREEELELANLHIFNMNPNYDYLINSYKKSMFSLLFNKTTTNKSMKLHSNGWLEVDIDVSQDNLVRGNMEKIKIYKKTAKISVIDDNRIEYLNKTVSLLKKHGTVVLVRLPVSDEMRKVEDNFDLKFNNRMQNISDTQCVPYLIYYDDNYIFPDGNHLYKESGKYFSILLANDINKLVLNE